MSVFRSHALRCTVIAVAVAVVATTGPVAAAQTPSPAARENALAAPVSTSGGRAAESYWTIGRMAAAVPADVLAVDPALGARTTVAPVGAPVTVAPAAGSLPESATPEARHASTVARPYTNRPDRLNGKVFFTLNGTNYVCSGTVVNGANKDLIDTAGHCVSDGSRTYATNWIFVPAYSSGKSRCDTAATCYPYGRWSARKLIASPEWHRYGNLKQDLGYGVLNTLNGRHIVDQLGGHGTTFNQSRTQTWRDYGYPAAAPFNGYDQKLCTSGRLGNGYPTLRPGPLTIRIHCNMTGGSSGGGWIVRMNSSGIGYLNSHNSYKLVGGSTDQMYGPYYGSEALSLYNAAQKL